MTTEREFSRYIMEMALIAGPVKAQALDGRTTGSKQEDRILALTDRESDISYWKARFDGARTDKAREDTLKDLRDLVEHLKRSRNQPLTSEQKRYWVVEQYEGVDARVASVEAGVPLDEVKRLRKEAGRSVEYGRVKKRRAA